VKVSGTQLEGTIVVIKRPIRAPSETGPGILRTATFTIPKDDAAGMTGPVFTGKKPFPLT
jgi:hypothetical protein